MNAYKNAHVNMIDAAILFLTDKKEAIMPFAPAIATDLADLIDVRTLIGVSLQKADVSTKPITENKKKLRNQVIKTGVKFTAAAIAHGIKHKDTTLTTTFRQLKTKLKKAKNADITVICGNLHEKLEDVAEHLVARGVTATDLTNHKADVEQFKADAPKVKNTRSTTGTENNQAKTLIDRAKEIVAEQIGGTLFSIQDKILTIYADFGKISTPQKPQRSSTALNLTVLDGSNDKKLNNVSMKHITDDAEHTGKSGTAKKPAKSREARTSYLGEATLTERITQNETWEITKEGYEPLLLTLPKLPRGKKHTLEVRLTPIAVSS